MSTGKVELPISIIMASYNNAGTDFLSTAIASIFDSNYIPNECIIIDDYSTDDSILLTKKIAQDIPQIRIIENSVNLGAQKSRDVGILEASNNYIAIVDSDDFLGENALKAAYEKALNNNADIVVWQVARTDAQGNNPQNMINVDPNLSFKGKEACELILVEWKLAALGLYKKELYLKTMEQFNENFFNADELFSRLIFSNAKKVMTCEGIYFYRNNNNSTTQKKSLKHLQLLDSQLWLINFASKYNFSKDIKRQLVRKFLGICKNILRDNEFYIKEIGVKDFTKKISEGIHRLNRLRKASFIETILDTSTVMRMIKLYIYLIYIKIFK